MCLKTTSQQNMYLGRRLSEMCVRKQPCSEMCGWTQQCGGSILTKKCSQAALQQHPTYSYYLQCTTESGYLNPLNGKQDGAKSCLYELVKVVPECEKHDGHSNQSPTDVDVARRRMLEKLMSQRSLPDWMSDWETGHLMVPNVCSENRVI